MEMKKQSEEMGNTSLIYVLVIRWSCHPGGTVMSPGWNARATRVTRPSQPGELE